METNEAQSASHKIPLGDRKNGRKKIPTFHLSRPAEENAGWSEEKDVKFWKRIKVTEKDCWEWQGAKVRPENPYGQIGVGGKTILVHRLAYYLKFGSIPQKMEVCHRCDNPSCINPEHLFLGTKSDNMKDMFRKGREPSHSFTHNLQTKLTLNQVTQIRKLIPSMRIKHIAKMFNVIPQTIRNIKTGVSWKSTYHNEPNNI